jgi:hypothetical protein
MQEHYYKVLGIHSYAPMGSASAIWARSLEQHGELCGPIVTLFDIEHMINISASEESMKSNLPPEENYKEFVQAYDDSQEEAKAAEKYRLVKKERARTEAAERRKRNSLQVVSKVEDLLDEPWREFALSHTETGFTGKSPCLAFKSALCGQLMNEFVISPSKAKKSIIKEIADKMNRCFQSISERQLLEFSFLSDEDPFEAALKRYCLGHFPDIKSVILCPRADRQFFEMVAEGEILDATDALFSAHPAELLLSVDPYLDQDFAENVWSYELNRCQEESCKRRMFSSVFAASVKALKQLKPTVEEFCARIVPGDEHYHDVRDRILWDYSLIEFLYARDFDGLLRGMDEFDWSALHFD